MPRQVDLAPQNLQLTHDPTQQISSDLKANAKDTVEKTSGTILQIPLMIVEGLAGAAVGFASLLGNLVSDVVEVVTGQEDGDTSDLGTWALNIRYGVQSTINAIVNSWFGWIGDLWDPDDAADALRNQADAVAALSSAMTALQNNQNNQAVGGQSAFVDFTARAASSSLGADFDQNYAGTGSSSNVLGIGNGAEYLVAVDDAPRTCNFTYNLLETATDYQKVGLAFGSAPEWSLGTVQPRNEIHGRKNAAGDTYVYAALELSKAKLGCVVSGSNTVFLTTPPGTFNFKSNSVYWLECGTVGGLRIFRLLEGHKPVLTHTEVGTTSQVGSGYRRSGGLVASDSSTWGTAKPARMAAIAISDNQPPTVVGSGARMFRTSTTGVDVSAGAHFLPDDFYSTLAEHTGDIECDLTEGSFTVSIEGHYDIHIQMGLADFWGGFAPLAPFPLFLTLYKTPAGGSPAVETKIGDVAMGYAISGFTTVSPRAMSGTARVYLQKGDSIRGGYNADTSATGVFIGDAAGIESSLGITLANRSLS